MTFDEVLAHVLDLLQRQGHVSYRALKRRFELDDEYLEDLAELIDAQRLAVDEDGKVLVWISGTATAAVPASEPERAHAQPHHLARQILHTKSSRRRAQQVTVLFADLKGSMELLADRDPEARQFPEVLERLMAAVHRYEGTVNQVLGDGIMALFERHWPTDHAVRACYAAPGHAGSDTALRRGGPPSARHRGTNPGRHQLREVVVRAIGNDYTWTTPPSARPHLAARMEQAAAGASGSQPRLYGWPKAWSRSPHWVLCRSRGCQSPWTCSSWLAPSPPGRACRRCGPRAHPLRGAAGGTRGPAPGPGSGRERPWASRGGHWRAEAWARRASSTSLHGPITQRWLQLESGSVSYTGPRPTSPSVTCSGATSRSRIAMTSAISARSSSGSS